MEEERQMCKSQRTEGWTFTGKVEKPSVKVTDSFQTFMLLWYLSFLPFGTQLLAQNDNVNIKISEFFFFFT